MQQAFIRGFLHIAEVLIAKGADIHDSQDLALKSACVADDVRSLNFLLADGADPRSDHGSVLIMACWLNTSIKHVLKRLLEFPMDQNTLNKGLVMASKSLDLDKVQLLLDKGADPYFEDMKCFQVVIERYPCSDAVQFWLEYLDLTKCS